MTLTFRVSLDLIMVYYPTNFRGPGSSGLGFIVKKKLLVSLKEPERNQETNFTKLIDQCLRTGLILRIVKPVPYPKII